MIYFDNAATTPISNNVKRAIIEAFDVYGNPSSQYDVGVNAKKIVQQSRHRIEKALGWEINSAVFTAGGSEADNLAIYLGWLYGLKRGRNKIIISEVEHHAIEKAADKLIQFGAVVEKVPVNAQGQVDLSILNSKIDCNTAIVSIMTSNNEVGTMMDMYGIAEITKKYGAILHTDAVQGITHTSFPPGLIDMISISGHKFNAPKGIGALYINPFLREEFKGFALIGGGKQEFGLRAGTENVPYIVGFAQAVEDLVQNKNERIIIEKHLHDYLINKLKKEFPYVKINGFESTNYKNPGIVNFSIGFADAASLVEWMNIHNICISSGSACNTGSPAPSHVLMAMYNDEKRAFSSVRISFSSKNNEREINEFIKVLKEFEKIYKKD